MIVGIGCDIVEMKRIENQRDTFIHRVLTKNEYAVCEGFEKGRKTAFLAGRFAAKEAIFKAILNCNLTISEIEILNDKEGQPYCNIEGYKIHISISHEQNYAIAYALVESI